MVRNGVTEAADGPMPVELLVGIADMTPRAAGARAPEPRTGADAEGGFSFNSATPIGPGTHRRSVVVGEAPFRRAELKAGQKLTVRAGVDRARDGPPGRRGRRRHLAPGQARPGPGHGAGVLLPGGIALRAPRRRNAS
ncbi:hypothetical protein ACF065_22955 [Streptomyces sp. NPDC015232]|uniref:hypothetical protein n=1 Tax=unclassified Streptomyces TaxID=2593676 RepID=UPI0036F5AE9F